MPEEFLRSVNIIRDEAEYWKSLVPVDLPGIGGRRLSCDAIGAIQSQAVVRNTHII